MKLIGEPHSGHALLEDALLILVAIFTVIYLLRK